ncbi:hypothetical protein [Streptomyces prunicolor]
MDNGAFHEQLVRLRNKAGIGEDIGVLCVFDVVAGCIKASRVRPQRVEL